MGSRRISTPRTIEDFSDTPITFIYGMNMIHEMLVRLGYIVDGFGQYSDEVIAHYRRVEAGSTQQNY